VAIDDATGRQDRSLLFFEDFTPGRVFELGTRVLSEADIVAFAELWDPQPIHLDATAAEQGDFGGLIASGWQTSCVWMRLYVDAVLNRAAVLTAPGVEEIRWLVPVRPGMALHGRTTILDSWPSESVPGRGTMRLRGELFDDGGRVVLSLLARGHARLRSHQEER
jgi:acyl dehydratase